MLQTPVIQGPINACIYCGGAARKARRGAGEHIVPEAIGGARTISDCNVNRTVCNKCNNGVLSQLDKELCSHSPLSIVAGRVLDGFIWQTWDVDHAAGNLLLEAKPDFDNEAMILYPQMIFDAPGVKLYCDSEEIQQFGSDEFTQICVSGMLAAFRAFETGKKRRLHLNRIRPNRQLLTGYRYPPRIFTRHGIAEITPTSSFELRYLTAAEKDCAIVTLRNWDPNKSFAESQGGTGSTRPFVRSLCDPGTTLRALLKLAVNLVAAYCPNTPVDRTTFSEVIRVVVGKDDVTLGMIAANGFVYSSDVDPIKHAGDAHAFRLLHLDGHWHVYSSYFGGRMGSSVRFPGPNNESWSCADIVAPIRSNKWEVNPSSQVTPCEVSVEWRDLTKLIPSIELENVRSEIRIEPGKSSQTFERG